MLNERIAVIRAVRMTLTDWLDSVRALPDPALQPRGMVKNLSAQIHLADAALRDAPASITTTDEWKKELAAYAEVLREVRARLSNFEITLRIRQSHMRQTSASLGIIRRWSDLAKQIG
jgi:hypothetical protein